MTDINRELKLRLPRVTVNDLLSNPLLRQELDTLLAQRQFEDSLDRDSFLSGCCTATEIKLHETTRRQMYAHGCDYCALYIDRFVALFNSQLGRSPHIHYSCRGCNNKYKE